MGGPLSQRLPEKRWSQKDNTRNHGQTYLQHKRSPTRWRRRHCCRTFLWSCSQITFAKLPQEICGPSQAHQPQGQTGRDRPQEGSLLPQRLRDWRPLHQGGPARMALTGPSLWRRTTGLKSSECQVLETPVEGPKARAHHMGRPAIEC